VSSQTKEAVESVKDLDEFGCFEDQNSHPKALYPIKEIQNNTVVVGKENNQKRKFEKKTNRKKKRI